MKLALLPANYNSRHYSQWWLNNITFMQDIVIIAGFVLQYGLPAFQKLVALLNKPAPTQSDWDEVFSLANKSYDEFIKGTK